MYEIPIWSTTLFAFHLFFLFVSFMYRSVEWLPVFSSLRSCENKSNTGSVSLFNFVIRTRTPWLDCKWLKKERKNKKIDTKICIYRNVSSGSKAFGLKHKHPSLVHLDYAQNSMRLMKAILHARGIQQQLSKKFRQTIRKGVSRKASSIMTAISPLPFPFFEAKFKNRDDAI